MDIWKNVEYDRVEKFGTKKGRSEVYILFLVTLGLVYVCEQLTYWRIDGIVVVEGAKPRQHE